MELLGQNTGHDVPTALDRNGATGTSTAAIQVEEEHHQLQTLLIFITVVHGHQLQTILLQVITFNYKDLTQM